MKNKFKNRKAIVTNKIVTQGEMYFTEIIKNNGGNDVIFVSIGNNWFAARVEWFEKE